MGNIFHIVSNNSVVDALILLKLVDIEIEYNNSVALEVGHKQSTLVNICFMVF